MPCRASCIPLSWAGCTSLKPFPRPPPPPLHHSPHLPLPRPWLLIREADAGGLRIYFAIRNFKRLAGIEAGTLPWRASCIPLSWAGCTSLKPFPRPPPPLHHSPHLPLPRPWLLIREADAGGLRIDFAILNFKRLAGIEPGMLSWRTSYIPLTWRGCTSLKPFPLLFRLCPPLPRLVTRSRNLNFTRLPQMEPRPVRAQDPP